MTAMPKRISITDCEVIRRIAAEQQRRGDKTLGRTAVKVLIEALPRVDLSPAALAPATTEGSK